jgi:hypothetical protein
MALHPVDFGSYRVQQDLAAMDKTMYFNYKNGYSDN